MESRTVKEMEEELETLEALGNPTEESVTTEEESPIDDILTEMTDDKEVDAGVEVDEEEEEPSKPTRTNWKKRYKKFKQATDASLYELRTEKSELLGQIQYLNSRMDSMQETMSKEQDATSFSDRFSDTDKEIFGEDALSSLEKATNDAVAPLKEQLAQEKEWRKHQTELQRAKASQEASQYFLTSLEDLVPNFSEVDQDPNFKTWMDLPDEGSGITRLTLFKNAEKAGDVSRVANFMLAFNDAMKPTDKLKDLVSPVSTSSATPTLSRDSKISTKFIDKFYSDIMKGRYRGNEIKRAEIETKIDKALAEGNVY